MRMIPVFLALITFPGLALAYVGPGLGAGVVGVVVGLIASVFLALFALFWYPIKRLAKRRKAKTSAVEAPATTTADAHEKQRPAP